MKKSGQELIEKRGNWNFQILKGKGQNSKERKGKGRRKGNGMWNFCRGARDNQFWHHYKLSCWTDASRPLHFISIADQKRIKLHDNMPVQFLVFLSVSSIHRIMTILSSNVALARWSDLLSEVSKTLHDHGLIGVLPLSMKEQKSVLTWQALKSRLLPLLKMF